jgi:hypothetical protein
MARFDEVELEPAVLVGTEAPPPSALEHAPRFRRLLALITDLSLFVALSLALSPLLPPAFSWTTAGALGGFVLLVSYYYFAGMWLLWGKTIGDASMAMRRASLRWLGVCLSLLTGGVGFALAALPSRLSLADRLSRTRSVSAV